MNTLKVEARLDRTVPRTGTYLRQIYDNEYTVCITGGTITEAGARRVRGIYLVKFLDLSTVTEGLAKYLFVIGNDTTKEQLEEAIILFMTQPD